jgi:hypothetical protein
MEHYIMQTLVKDSRKKARTLSVTGMIKPSGMICAKVINDRNETYFVTIKPNGQTTCKCKGHEHTGHCYHVDAVKEQAATFPTFDELANPKEDALVCKPVVCRPAKTTKTRSTTPRYTLLALQDNRSVYDKIFGSLGSYSYA